MQRPGWARAATARGVGGGVAALVAGSAPLRRLAGTFAVATLAEWAYVTALAVVALERGGALAIGVVGLRLFVAAAGSIAVAPSLGRHHPAAVMSASTAGRALVVGASAVLAATGAPLAPLLVLVGAEGLLASLYRPAQASITPLLARSPAELSASAATLSTTKTLSQALGAVLGGTLLSVAPPDTVFSVAAGCFALSAVGTAPLRATAVPWAPAPPGVLARLRRTLRTGADERVRGLVVVSALRTLVRGMWTALAVLTSFRLLHAGSAGVGLLMLAGGVGALLAVPFSAGLLQRRRLSGPASGALVACGLPLGILAGAPLVDVGLVLIVAWGVGMAVADVATSALLVRSLPTGLLGRATSTVESAKLAAEGLGALVAPALAAAAGIRVALLLAAVPLPVVVLSGQRILRRTDAEAAERSGLLQLLHAVGVFAPLDVVGLETVAASARPLRVAAGTDAVRQGDLGDCFYVVRAGAAEVLVDGFRVSTLGAGQGFGERALLRRGTRTATVRATEDLDLLAVDRAAFLLAVTGQEGPVGDAPAAASARPGTDERSPLEALRAVSLLAGLDGATLAHLARRGEVRGWAAGERIVTRGEVGDRFFVLLRGAAEVTTPGSPPVRLHPGDHFGDIAVLHGVPRTADVTATEASATVSVTREDLLPAVRDRLLPG